jgi:hypothetical protein
MNLLQTGRMAVLCLLFAGGAYYQKTTTTSFAQLPDGFEFKAVADANHPLDDPVAESKSNHLS